MMIDFFKQFTQPKTMHFVQWTASQQQNFKRLVVIAITTTSLIILPAVAPVQGQEPKLPEIAIPGLNNTANSTTDSSRIATGEVQLDGRRLFAIAAPAITEGSKDQQSVTPIKERVEGIESVLERIVQSDYNPKELEVVAETDTSSGLPVITVNDQYIMTVTTLDAQLQGRDPTRQAEELTRIIRSALVRAERERQPEYLSRQSLLASQIIVGILFVSWGIGRIQNRLKRKHKRITTRIPAIPEITPNTSETADTTTAETVQQRMTVLRQRNLNDAQRRLLELAQAGVWGGGIFVILGLFPFTRWLQPLILSGPLRVVAIILITYTVIRIIDILIDRFFSAIEDGAFVSPEHSQRLVLRVSTFSRVLKSLTAVICVGAGIIATLSIIGVELGPVLAGAGIIGLAISFAAQSLVKDMINGLLILFEDQYAVGDVIAVGTVSGLVEHMNLRITQLRNAEGRLITIPNSAISVVENLSKDWSRVDLAIVIAYDADIDQALSVINEVGEKMIYDPAWREQIPEPPEVLGVDQIDNTGITIRIWIKTQPLQQWNVAREFRRRLKKALDEKDISIGVPQQSLRFRDTLDLNEKLLDKPREEAWHPSNSSSDSKS
jgi:moderate conductance mechanosensitive channel